MKILYLKGYKWLLSQNQRVRIDFLVYTRYEVLAKHIKPFCPLKFRPKVCANNVDFLTIKITSKKVSGNKVDFSTREIASTKSTWKKRGYFDQRIYVKKVRGNSVDISSSKITPKKVRGNNADFSTTEITSKKVRGNDVRIRRNDENSTTKIRNDENSSKIPTSKRRRFDMVCHLGTCWTRRKKGLHMHQVISRIITKQTFTCSKSPMETICEICLKLLTKTPDVILVSLFLTLNRYHSLFWCFHCWY